MRVAACLAAGALAAFALAPPAPAQVRCAQLSESEALDVSDVVFEGVVGGESAEGAEAELTPGKPPEVVLGPRDFPFRVARHLRGDGPDVVMVRKLPIAGSFPSAEPTPGEAWRVYATRDPSSGRLSFNPCVPYSRPLESADAVRVRELLGSSAGPETKPIGGDDDGGGVPLALLIGIGAVAVAAAALLTVRLLRSS